ncbi:MAG TPA: calcium-binding protein [Thermodesulfobacteriota bacterium]|nr:calcium-binding protein [Thermodesulfobacteriota bacterium]
MRHLSRVVLLAVLLTAPGAFFSQTAFAVFFCNGQVATIVGTNGPNLIFGTPGRDVIVGLGGNDDIRSGGGNDVVCAGGGNDVVRLGGGADQGFGGPGNDTIFGQAGNDLVVGGIGNDTLRGNNGNDNVNGAAGSDDCDGGAGSNSILNCENGPAICQSPPLTTNFSNIGVYFVDSFNAILVGLSSNGFDVVMVLSDIPFNGALLAVGGFPTSSTHCIITEGAFDTDMDGNFSDEIVFGASGICDLPFNRTVLFLDNLVVAGEPLGFNITGECSEIIVINSATARGEQASTEAMTDGLIEGMSVISEEMTEDMRNEGGDNSGDAGLLKDFMNNMEE